ncbi:hypothetical protein R1flu_013899 [Riccia fluitans]|uniref:Uncharacterized protein n=1 Tax=Riccia fluitans TaxID=41844 RepID=A0ABD1YEX9_9MARC
MEARRSSFEPFYGSGGGQSLVGDSQPSYFSQGFNLSQFPIPMMPSAPSLFPFMRPPISFSPMTSPMPPTPTPIPGSFASSSATAQVPPILMSGPSVPPVRPLQAVVEDKQAAYLKTEVLIQILPSFPNRQAQRRLIMETLREQTQL